MMLISVPLLLLMVMLIVLSVLGNMLVVLSVLLVKHLRQPANLLLLSLALTDLLVSLIVMPGALYQLLSGGWSLPRSACLAWIFSDVFLCTSSILTLTVICVDRYYAISQPLHYIPRRSHRLILFSVVCIQLLAALVSAPALATPSSGLVPLHSSPRRPPHTSASNDSLHHLYGSTDSVHILAEDGEVSDLRPVNQCLVSQSPAYQLYATMCSFYLPLIVMVVLYFKIYSTARGIIHKERYSPSISRKQSTFIKHNTKMEPAERGISHLQRIINSLTSSTNKTRISANPSNGLIPEHEKVKPVFSCPNGREYTETSMTDALLSAPNKMANRQEHVPMATLTGHCNTPVMKVNGFIPAKTDESAKNANFCNGLVKQQSEKDTVGNKDINHVIGQSTNGGIHGDGRQINSSRHSTVAEPSTGRNWKQQQQQIANGIPHKVNDRINPLGFGHLGMADDCYGMENLNSVIPTPPVPDVIRLSDPAGSRSRSTEDQSDLQSNQRSGSDRSPAVLRTEHEVSQTDPTKSRTEFKNCANEQVTESEVKQADQERARTTQTVTPTDQNCCSTKAEKMSFRTESEKGQDKQDSLMTGTGKDQDCGDSLRTEIGKEEVCDDSFESEKEKDEESQDSCMTASVEEEKTMDQNAQILSASRAGKMSDTSYCIKVATATRSRLKKALSVKHKVNRADVNHTNQRQDCELVQRLGGQEDNHQQPQPAGQTGSGHLPRLSNGFQGCVSCPTTPTKESSAKQTCASPTASLTESGLKPRSPLLRDRLSSTTDSVPCSRSHLLSTSCPLIADLPREAGSTLPEDPSKFLAKHKSTSLLLYRCFAGVGNHARQEWKATLTVGIVLLTFLVCWLPFFVLALYSSLAGKNSIPVWVNSVALWLGYTNSMLNPIIYGVLHRDFRRTFINILSCKLFRSLEINRI